MSNSVLEFLSPKAFFDEDHASCGGVAAGYFCDARIQTAVELAEVFEEVPGLSGLRAVLHAETLAVLDHCFWMVASLRFCVEIGRWVDVQMRLLTCDREEVSDWVIWGVVYFTGGCSQ